MLENHQPNHIINITKHNYANYLSKFSKTMPKSISIYFPFLLYRALKPKYLQFISKQRNEQKVSNYSKIYFFHLSAEWVLFLVTLNL